MVKAIWKNEETDQEITLVYDLNERFVYSCGFSDKGMLREIGD